MSGDAIRSDMGWSTADRIVVLGKDLPGEILGKVDLAGMAFLELTGRLPEPREAHVFNAIVVTLVEHGITPSALAARLTFLGAPEALQAAVAAGLCGVGSVFVGSTEGAARLLLEAIPDPREPGDLDRLARDLVARLRAERQQIPGIGHPVHKPVDPRTPRLFAIARENGFDGPYIGLMQRIAAEAERATGKSLPVNATGAVGAIACELGFDWRICRGLGVIARSIGLVGHLLEESRRPIAAQVWHRIEAEATAHIRAKSGADEAAPK